MIDGGSMVLEDSFGWLLQYTARYPGWCRVRPKELRVGVDTYSARRRAFVENNAYILVIYTTCMILRPLYYPVLCTAVSILLYNIHTVGVPL